MEIQNETLTLTQSCRKVQSGRCSNGELNGCVSQEITWCIKSSSTKAVIYDHRVTGEGLNSHSSLPQITSLNLPKVRYN